jgi:hypothetical protein
MSEHKRNIAIATRDRLAREVERLERELFRGLGSKYEDEMNAYKREIAALRVALTRAERAVAGRKKKPEPPKQEELFK